MNNREFDEILKKRIADEELNVNEDMWRVLAERLEKHSPQKKTALYFLPFINYRAIAAVLLLAVGIWFILSQNPRSEKLMSKNVPHKNVVPRVSPAYMDTAMKIVSVQKSVNTTVAKDKPSRTVTQLPLATPPASSQQEKVNTVNEFIDTPAPAVNVVTSPKNNFTTLPFYDDNTNTGALKKTFSLLVNGGVALLNSQVGYTIGITMLSKISKKVSFEASIGYINNNNNLLLSHETYTQVQPPIITTDTGTVIPELETQAITTYEQIKRNISYLRVAPALTVQVNKKISTSLGVDLRKTLLNNNALEGLNTQLSDGAAVIPDIDPGLFAGINYELADRLETSVSYRSSLLKITKPQTDYLNQDYLQFSIRYLLVK